VIDRHPTAIADIEQLLVEVRSDIVYPEVTDLRGGIRRRIALDGTRAAPRTPMYRRPVLVAAVVVIVATIALIAAIPGSRNAVADWLGLRGVRIEQPRTPEDLVPAGTDLALGTPTTLSKARRSVDFTVSIPTELGPPDAVHLSRRPPGGRVSLLYLPSDRFPAAGRDDVGLLVSEFTAEINDGVLGKILATDSTLERITVDGRRGYWISGGPHIVGVLDRNGDLYQDRTRLAANTLLVQDGDRILRIESALSRDEAIAIARTLVD